MLTLIARRGRPGAPPQSRRGVSLLEIIIAMTILAFVVGSLSLLSAKSARRGRELDIGSARTFVLMQQSNRFSVLPYDSISVYAPRIDTVITGRFKYLRRVTYTQSTTGSDYKIVKVILLPLPDTTRRDSLIFVRAKTYDHSPLFTQ
jgi:prepilin-type N-terminal cleavage/methylation domain-containing protein